MSSVVVYVTAADQNADETNDGSMHTSPTSSYALETNPGNSAYALWWGCRFLNSGIPQGATITSAVPTYWFLSGSNWGNTVTYADKSTAATAFSTAANDLSSRTRTTASGTKTGSATKSSYNNFTDITAVIQELVDQAAWTGTSPIVVLVTNTSTSQSWAPSNYGSNAADAAYITIGYTATTRLRSFFFLF